MGAGRERAGDADKQTNEEGGAAAKVRKEMQREREAGRERRERERGREREIERKRETGKERAREKEREREGEVILLCAYIIACTLTCLPVYS